jgi:hypothetical protein
VSRLEQSLVLAAAGIMTYSTASLADEQISDVADLTAVIALQGKPCGKVVNAAKKGEDDYVATCEDGNRYHVFVSNGRVVVEKQQ